MAWLRSARCSRPSSLTTDSSSTTILLPRPQKQVCLAHFWANWQKEFILYKTLFLICLCQFFYFSSDEWTDIGLLQPNWVKKTFMIVFKQSWYISNIAENLLFKKKKILTSYKYKSCFIFIYIYLNMIVVSLC